MSQSTQSKRARKNGSFLRGFRQSQAIEFRKSGPDRADDGIRAMSTQGLT